MRAIVPDGSAEPSVPAVCLVGCGAIGATHARNLRGRARLSFCSGKAENARRFQHQYGGERVYDGYDEVLADAAVDGVVLATPPQLHCEQVVAALGAGKGVLVEKPMCVSPEEVATIAAAAAGGRGPALMVAENYYYRATHAYVKEQLAMESLGPLLGLSVRKLSQQNATGWKSGYGALLEGGVHMVAMISDLVGQAPEKVTAEFPGADNAEPERHSRTRLEYADGMVAQLEYSWSTPTLARGIFQHSCVYGERGRLVFETNGLYAWINTAVTPRQLFLPLGQDLLGYREMMMDFLACLRDPERRPYSDLARARRELEIVFRAYEGLSREGRRA